MHAPHRNQFTLTHCKPALSEADQQLRRLLKSSPQELWLDTIRRTNGPEHNGLVHWMLAQIECDFSVAFHAFYRSDPASFLEEPTQLPPRPGVNDIFAQVLLNWETGSYRTQRFRVEAIDAPLVAIAKVDRLVREYPAGTMPFQIPRRFVDPKGGVNLRLPSYLSPDHAAHLWPLYAEMGLRVRNEPPGLKRTAAQVKSLLRIVARSA